MIVDLIPSFRTPLKAGLALLLKHLEEDAKNQEATPGGKERADSASKEAARVAALAQRLDASASDQVTFEGESVEHAALAAELYVKHLRAACGQLKSLLKLDEVNRFNDQADELEKTLVPIFRGGQMSLAVEGKKKSKKGEEAPARPPLFRQGQRPPGASETNAPATPAAAADADDVLDEPPPRPSKTQLEVIRGAAETGR